MMEVQKAVGVEDRQRKISGLEMWARGHPAAAKVLRCGLLLTIWVVFLLWNFWWWASGTKWFGEDWEGIEPDVDSGLFDKWEYVYWGSVAPLVVVVILAAIFLQIPEPRPTREEIADRNKPPRWYRKLTSGVLMSNRFVGTVTFGEIFWAVYLFLFLLWTMDRNMEKFDNRYRANPTRFGKYEKWSVYTARFAIYSGRLASLVYAILLIPVSKGGVVLRLLDIPYERAVRYHRWLGHTLFCLLIPHIGLHIIVWADRGTLSHELKQWEKTEVPIPPGIMAATAGLILWVMTIPYLRRRCYELFYNAHMVLFVLFSLFAFWHEAEFMVIYATPALFLWGLDRLARSAQRWRRVSVIATRELPDGTIQVEILKREDTKYWPLQHLNVCFPELSYIQWHPFSVESNPCDSDTGLVFHIKPLGNWTGNFKSKAAQSGSSSPSNGCPLRSLTVDGLYGHQSNFFLKYPVLLLFAGGSGMVPFVSLIREILHRHLDEDNGDTTALPHCIVLVWAVKHASELLPLQDISPSSIQSGKRLSIVTMAYVTREAVEDTSLEKGQVLKDAVLVDNAGDGAQQPLTHAINKNSSWQEVFVLTATFVGFLFTHGLFVSTIIEPTDHSTHENFPHWQRSTVYIGALIVSILVWGGLSLLICHLLNTRSSKNKGLQQSTSLLTKSRNSGGRSQGDSLLSTATITYGERPDISGFFNSVGETHKGARICTMASGPDELNIDVAAQCQSYNGGLSKLFDREDSYFDYHSVTYSL